MLLSLLVISYILPWLLLLVPLGILLCIIPMVLLSLALLIVLDLVVVFSMLLSTILLMPLQSLAVWPLVAFLIVAMIEDAFWELALLMSLMSLALILICLSIRRRGSRPHAFHRCNNSQNLLKGQVSQHSQVRAEIIIQLTHIA